MKKILLSMALVVSLLFGGTLAMADTLAKPSGQSIHTMSGQQAGKGDLNKGLNEAIVVETGKNSWVLHRPAERYPQYFNSTNDEKKEKKFSREQGNPRS